MLPQPFLPGVVVFEQRQLHLQLALGGVRVQGEDVEDQACAIHHTRVEAILERALLAGCQLALGRHDVGLDPLDLLDQLLQTSLAKERAGMRMVLMLHDDIHGLGSGRAQQLPDFGDAVVFFVAADVHRRDNQRPLDGFRCRERALLAFPFLLGLAAICPLKLTHRSASCRSARRRARAAGQEIHGPDDHVVADGAVAADEQAQVFDGERQHSDRPRALRGRAGTARAGQFLGGPRPDTGLLFDLIHGAPADSGRGPWLGQRLTTARTRASPGPDHVRMAPPAKPMSS